VSRTHPAATARPLRVGIVGGGPGGLFTAWHLERLASAPLEITIFEQAERLGGKLLSPSFAAAPVRYEAGAAEFYDYSHVADDPLRELVGSLELPTVPLAGAAVYLGGRRIANLDDLADRLGPAARERLLAFDARARAALSPSDFYESGSDHAADMPPDGFPSALCPLGSPARGYVETMIHSDLATEPAATSTAYGLQNYLMNDPAYMRLYRIAGGNEQLVTGIAARLAARVRLAAAVTRIVGEPGGPLTVYGTERDRPLAETFDAVVLALPVEPLARLVCEPPGLAAALGRHLAHHDHPAHYLRITLLLDRPLGGIPGEDDYLMLDAFGGSCLYIESGRDPTACHGVLGWLLGGEAAREMAGWSDDDLATAVLDTLPAPLAPWRESMVEARVHRWAGAVSGLPGGWSPLSLDRRHRPAPAHPNLFLVGDYLFDSTLNGVLDSAEHVAGWLVAEQAAGMPAGSKP
jgi:phytoene dehydrogenase-like protein